MLAESLEQEAGIEFGQYLTEAIFDPLGMTSSVLGGGGDGWLRCGLQRRGSGLCSPSICCGLARSRRRCMPRRVGFSSRPGRRLPGFGMQRPNDWGLGFEIRDGKSPHWTAATNSPSTYGHFGQRGHSSGSIRSAISLWWCSLIGISATGPNRLARRLWRSHKRVQPALAHHGHQGAQ